MPCVMARALYHPRFYCPEIHTGSPGSQQDGSRGSAQRETLSGDSETKNTMRGGVSHPDSALRVNGIEIAIFLHRTARSGQIAFLYVQPQSVEGGQHSTTRLGDWRVVQKQFFPDEVSLLGLA